MEEKFQVMTRLLIGLRSALNGLFLSSPFSSRGAVRPIAPKKQGAKKLRKLKEVDSDRAGRLQLLGKLDV